MAERMIQQEREQRLQQKADLNEVLDHLVVEKQHNKRLEQEAKYQDYLASNLAKQHYDQYLNNVKDNKNEFQKFMRKEYDQERQQKDEEFQRESYNRNQIEQGIVHNALDSLEKEKVLNDRKRMEYKNTMEHMLREKDLQKRREQEAAEQYRREHLQLLDDNTRNLDMKDQNYRMYYQRIGDKQQTHQQAYDNTTGFAEREKNKHLDYFVDKGVVEARKKAEEEAYRQQVRRAEQLNDMNTNNKGKIQEHEQEKYQQKQEYWNKVEELRRKNEEMTRFNEQQKKDKMLQTMSYKEFLDYQAKEAELLRRKNQAEMLEHEKKMHLETFEGFIPGIRSSKVDDLVNPQMKATLNGSPLRPHAGIATRNVLNDNPISNLNQSRDISPARFEVRSPLAGNKSPYFDDIRSPKNNNNNNVSNLLSGSFIQSPKNGAPISPAKPVKQDHVYNPITNPVPQNIQNPYIVKDIQRGGFLPRHHYAVMRDQNMIGQGR